MGPELTDNTRHFVSFSDLHPSLPTLLNSLLVRPFADRKVPPLLKHVQLRILLFVRYQSVRVASGSFRIGHCSTSTDNHVLRLLLPCKIWRFTVRYVAAGKPSLYGPAPCGADLWIWSDPWYWAVGPLASTLCRETHSTPACESGSWRHSGGFTLS